MRKLLLLLLLLLAPVAWAQEAALTVPVVRESEAKYTMKRITIEAAEAYFFVSVQDANGVEIREQVFRVPDTLHPSATIAGIFTALDTLRAGETGGVLRRANFRLLGFLLDNGYLPAATLNP